MALAPCRECQASISTEAATCPHCGVSSPHGAAPPKKRKGRARRVIFWFFNLLFVGGCVAFALVLMTPMRPRTTTSTSSAARFAVKVETEEYGYGYLKIVGTVENVGAAAAFSPSLKIRVLRDGTVLAEDTVWPAGMLLKSVEPGAKA
jgi:hypothetical protein